jgi:two-component system nitrogen regulation response regulator GlnG
MPGSLLSAEGLMARLDERNDQTLLLEQVEALGLEAQVALSTYLDSAQAKGVGAPRLIVTSELGLREAAGAGLLRHDLAGQLDRLRLFVPALADRREEIEALITHFLVRESEQRATPVLDEEALALLWRQPWVGGVREVESFLLRLLNEAEDREVLGAEFVSEVAAEGHHELIQKIPSRHPRRADLLAALVTTATQGGRANKARAARFLGWDPDTLVARMEDLEIPEEGFGELHRPWMA